MTDVQLHQAVVALVSSLVLWLICCLLYAFWTFILWSPSGIVAHHLTFLGPILALSAFAIGLWRPLSNPSGLLGYLLVLSIACWASGAIWRSHS